MVAKITVAVLGIAFWIAIGFGVHHLMAKSNAPANTKPAPLAMLKSVLNDDGSVNCGYNNCTLTAKTAGGIVTIEEFTCTGAISRQFSYCKEHFLMFYPEYKKTSDEELKNEVFTKLLNERDCK